MKIKINLIILFFLFSYCLYAEYSDSITETEFSEADSIVISRKANIVLIDENKYTSDKINYNFVFKNVWLNEDSFVMYLNNNIIVETTTITNDTIEVELSFENTINLIKIIVLDKNNNILLDYNDTLYYITETNYSLTDSIVIKGIIKDIIMFNYLRIKQILYNDNEIFNYNNWINISNKKNDMYYREPNMNYLKYKRL